MFPSKIHIFLFYVEVRNKQRKGGSEMGWGEGGEERLKRENTRGSEREREEKRKKREREKRGTNGERERE